LRTRRGGGHQQDCTVILGGHAISGGDDDYGPTFGRTRERVVERKKTFKKFKPGQLIRLDVEGTRKSKNEKIAK